MIHTIKHIKIKIKKGELEGRVFLLAGHLHLLPYQGMNPSFDVSSLYRALSKISAIIVATHRVVQVHSMTAIS